MRHCSLGIVMRDALHTPKALALINTVSSVYIEQHDLLSQSVYAIFYFLSFLITLPTFSKSKFEHALVACLKSYFTGTNLFEYHIYRPITWLHSIPDDILIAFLAYFLKHVAIPNIRAIKDFVDEDGNTLMHLLSVHTPPQQQSSTINTLHKHYFTPLLAAHLQHLSESSHEPSSKQMAQ